MKLDDIPFGTFQEVEPRIMEIIIHENVVFDDKKISLTEDSLMEKYSDLYCLLINRVHTYHHTKGSMARVANFVNAVAFAIVVYNTTSETYVNMHKHFKKNIDVFQDGETAMKGLIWKAG